MRCDRAALPPALPPGRKPPRRWQEKADAPDGTPAATRKVEGSADCLDVHEVACEANGLWHGHVQEEGCTSVLLRRRGDQIGPCILNNVDATVREQLKVHRKRFSGAFGWYDLHRPGVLCDQHDLLRGEPLGGGLIDPRFGRIVDSVHGRILKEQILPTSMNEHRVAFP